jgi:Skp family chaperone for outer membrane proteins
MHPSSDPPNTAAAETTRLTASGKGRLPEDGEGEHPGNVDKIRDILFGSQMREYDRRFSRFEERLLKESAEVREDLKRRCDSIESYVRTEIESLHERLQKEQGHHSEAIRDLTHELREGQRAWEKKIVQVEEQLARSQREFRQQLLEESKRLGDHIELRAREGSTLLEREMRSLSERSQDRFALADLFTEFAMRLRNELTMPDEK